MKEYAEKFVDEVNEIIDLVMNEMFNSDMLDYIDEKAFMLYKKSLHLLDMSADLLLMQSELLDNMNEKIDKLLENQRRIES